MDEQLLKDFRDTIVTWQGQARKQQAEGQAFSKKLGDKDGWRDPGKFTESSYLYIRSCDADQGFRPIPCGVFWLSPDILVRPLADLGAPTRELRAGHSYRLSAVVRNRGDLMVPAAKVEFFMVNPSLGFDVRFATRIGVGQGSVDAFGATEVSVDYQVPVDLAGHYCLFARVFCFAPLDLPYSDYALDPTIDRHVAQQNLSILAAQEFLDVGLVHFPNAQDRIELLPLTTAEWRAIRDESTAGLRVMTPARAEALMPHIGFTLTPAKVKGLEVGTENLKTGLMIMSRSRSGPSIDEVNKLTAALDAAQKAAQGGATRELAALQAEYRKLTGTQMHSQLRLSFGPELRPKGIKIKGRVLLSQAAGFHLRRTDAQTGRVTGGITFFLKV